MMVSKRITLLAQTENFNEDIREWRRQTANIKKWSTLKIFFCQSHCEQIKEVATAGKGGYVGRQLKARSVSFIQFLVTSRVLKVNNPYVHQPSLQASKASKLHIRLQPKVHHEDRSEANLAPFKDTCLMLIIIL